MKAIFVHGGPGLNSNPEHNILKDDFIKSGLDVIFWNEPRVFSTDNYYDEILESLVELVNFQESDKVVLIGHSFGCKIIFDILPLIKYKIQSICFLSPVLNFSEADMNIIKFGLNLLEEDSNESAIVLKNIIPNLTKELDETKVQALVLAYSSNIFNCYFSSIESFNKYFSYLQGDNEFRFEDYVKIRKSMSTKISESNEVFDIPLLVFFGLKDPVCNAEHEEQILKKYFTDVNINKLENISHYPHIDKKEVFLRELTEIY